MELKIHTSNECFFQINTDGTENSHFKWMFFSNQQKTDVLSFWVLISGVQYLLIVLLYALFGKNHSRTCPISIF